MSPLLSIVIPVYRNEGSLRELVSQLGQVGDRIRTGTGDPLEVVFVVDGSPDRSHAVLQEILPEQGFQSQLLLHSRNFGAFEAIRTGLAAARGRYFCVLAADLQEPTELSLRFLEVLAGNEIDVVVGCRETRQDPFLSRLFSAVFWKLYKKLVIRELPEKGVDVFGCNRVFRDHLVSLSETHSSLIGLIYWLGFRRSEVSYHRKERMVGKSAWTFRRKLKYLSDSIFSFTDLPIHLLTLIGCLGVSLSTVFGLVVFLCRLFGWVTVPGYAATVITVVFFGGINSLGLAVIGSYTWRAFENTKRRPLAVVMSRAEFGAGAGAGGEEG